MFATVNGLWKATKNLNEWLVDCDDTQKPPLVFTISGQNYSIPFHQLITRSGNRCTLDVKRAFLN